MTHCYLAVMLLAVAGEDAPVDFDTHVIPVLTRGGCNAGACHGAAIGRGGFKLSLYGGDPRADYDAITRQLGGRRVNLAHPDQSLLLAKPTGFVDHGGGLRLDGDGPGAGLLERWIRQGGRRNKLRKLVDLQVTPKESVGPLNVPIELRATARFDNGESEDVTQWTVWKADDPASVVIDSKASVAKVRRRGRHIVVARYIDRVVALALMVPLSEKPVAFSPEQHRNQIDDHILKALQTLRIPVSPIANDATWLRRIRLDLTGTLPKPEEAKSFLDDKRDDKRARKVDELLASEEFTDYWCYQLAKLFRIRTQPQDKLGAQTYHGWLRRQIAQQTSYDAIARRLLTAVGDTHENGPANFYRTVSGPREQAEFFSELFMGTRLRCANCHNHPLDRWTQDDYHGLAAIFAKVQQGRTIRVGTRGEVTHPRTGEAAVARIPGDRYLNNPGDGRQALAAWVTGQRNPYFARAIVNRLWKTMMGRGLIEPSDDVRDTNPPTHPELLDFLVSDFVEHGYKIRHTLKLIADSAAYQRSATSSSSNRADDRFYSHAAAKPLAAEVLADAISRVTAVPERFPGFPLGTRAIVLFDSRVPSTALDVLGRCSREDTCETPVGSESGGLSQKLHLANGKLLNAKITSAKGRLHRLLSDGADNRRVIEDFYLLGLSRLPTTAERNYWLSELSRARKTQDRKQVLEDFLWSLLSCREFVTNH